MTAMDEHGGRAKRIADRAAGTGAGENCHARDPSDVVASLAPLLRSGRWTTVRANENLWEARMHGPHDVGGLPAGPVDTEAHAVTFWEKQIDAINLLLAKKGLRR